jgi:quercetin dioxygenase-like cupin family protein
VASVKGPDATFTGDVDVEFSIPERGESRVSGGRVTFHPGARSHWHTHPCGQLLIITSGKGRVQPWGEPIQEVNPGDLVWFPAGVKHWHGAAPDSAMTHYAIQEESNGAVADWMEGVTDEQYRAKTIQGESQ